MIHPSTLTDDDRGRGVVYRARGGDRVEDGVVAGWNGNWIFVRYWLDLVPWERGPLSAPVATAPEDLEWLTGSE